MRIIDKNTDFYDFYQGVYRDNSITFDRTDSFLLTKAMLCEYLSIRRNRFNRKFDLYQFALLQVCNTFWLFLLEITKQDEKNGYWYVRDYNVELLASWKNYNKQRRLISLDIIRFPYDVDSVMRHDRRWMEYDKEKFHKRTDVLMRAIDTMNFDIVDSINQHTIYKGGDYSTRIEKHIPLLKACGIAACVEPLDIYLAFEEYFSLEKSSSERTESAGLTDNEKIGNHGFDLKKSFRGK